jgi:hypothetical protein
VFVLVVEAGITRAVLLVQVAGFRCTPNKGRLQPLQSQNVVISFCPGQLGTYNSTLLLSLCDGLASIPIRVFGKCSSIGSSKTLSKGVNMPTATFQPKYTFVPQDSTIDSTVLEEAGFAGSSVLDASAAKGGAKGTWRRPKPWDPLLGENGVTVETVLTDVKYTGTIRDIQKVRRVTVCSRTPTSPSCVFVAVCVADCVVQAAIHKAKYTEFVRKQRSARVGTESVDTEVRACVRACEFLARVCGASLRTCVVPPGPATQEKQASPWDDPVSLGMNPRASLDEPALVAPPSTEVRLVVHRVRLVLCAGVRALARQCCCC